MTLFLFYARMAYIKKQGGNEMTNTQWATYDPIRETHYCAICGQEICITEHEHARLPENEYICMECAEDAHKLLDYIGGVLV